MRASVLLLAFALGLAGCVSGGDDVESARMPADAASDAANATAEVEAADEAPAEVVPREFPFSVQGRTGLWLCVPTGPSSCTGPPVSTPMPSSNTFLPLEHEGAPRAVEATLTWSAATPATQQMAMSVFAARSCGDGCIETDGEMYAASAAGTSPLVLSAPDITLGDNESLYLHVRIVRPTSSLPVPLFYSLEQEFALEGVLTALVPEAGA